jgi:DNA-binding MarR family transcriptional regulator
VLVYLTEKGWTMHDGMKSIFNHLEELTVKGFSKEEILQLTNYLSKVYENVKSEETTVENI